LGFTLVDFSNTCENILFNHEWFGSSHQSSVHRNINDQNQIDIHLRLDQHETNISEIKDILNNFIIDGN